jgi:hypothetical protein
MGKELMWVCGIIPAELNSKLVVICKRANRGVNLPEDVFKFPLHISMKKSFYTTQFDEAKQLIKSFILRKGAICCGVGQLQINKNMIWLPIATKGQLQSFHDELDKMLLTNFGILITPFDAHFQPHISLFTKGSEGQIAQMYDILKEQITPVDITINKFVIGSSLHKDEFFEV